MQKSPTKADLTTRFCNFIACYQPERGKNIQRSITKLAPVAISRNFAFYYILLLYFFYNDFISEETKICIFMPILKKKKLIFPNKILESHEDAQSQKKLKNQVINSLKINFMKQCGKNFFLKLYIVKVYYSKDFQISMFRLFKEMYQGDLQDGRGVRTGNHLPPHKYIRNTSTCG